MSAGPLLDILKRRHRPEALVEETKSRMTGSSRAHRENGNRNLLGKRKEATDRTVKYGMHHERNEDVNELLKILNAKHEDRKDGLLETKHNLEPQDKSELHEILMTKHEELNAGKRDGQNGVLHGVWAQNNVPPRYHHNSPHRRQATTRKILRINQSQAVRYLSEMSQMILRRWILLLPLTG